MIKYYINSNNSNNYIIKKNGILYIYLKQGNKLFFFNYMNLNILLDCFFVLKKKCITEVLNFFFFSWKYFILKKIKFKHKIT